MSIARSITTLSRRSLIKGAASLGALIPLSALVAGCSTDDEAAPDTDEQAPVTENEPSGSAGTAGATAAGGSVLVAYYSAQGHTEAVAQAIADELGADLFAVTPAEPYTDADLDWTDDESRVSREHDDESLRNVALSQVTPDGWEGYGTVFVGYPIWWGIAAWPIDNFISGNDWAGKTVIPFCTSASSSLGQSSELLAEAARTGDWQEGQRFSSNADEDEVRTWAAGIA